MLQKHGRFHQMSTGFTYYMRKCACVRMKTIRQFIINQLNPRQLLLTYTKYVHRKISRVTRHFKGLYNRISNNPGASTNILFLSLRLTNLTLNIHEHLNMIGLTDRVNFIDINNMLTYKFYWINWYQRIYYQFYLLLILFGDLHYL